MRAAAFIIWFGLAGCGGDTPAVAPPRSALMAELPALPPPGALPAWAGALDARHVNLVVVEDVLPWARAIVEAPGVVDAFGGPDGVAPKLRDALLANQAYIPKRLVLANAQMSAFASAVGRTNVLLRLFSAAMRTPAAASEVAGLRDATVAAAGQLDLPAHVALVEFRDETTASLVFTAIGLLIANLEEYGVSADAQPDRIEARGHLGREALIASLLAPLRTEDADVQAVADALGQVHAWLVFERRGASLRLELASGPPPAGVGRFQVAQLGAVWQPGALVHAAWDLGDLARASREGTALFGQWAGSAAMAAAVSSDDDFGLDDVRRQFLQLAGYATRGSARIDVADGVSLLGEYTAGEPTPPLVERKALDLVPATATWLNLDADEELGALIDRGIDQFEKRLATNALKDVAAEAEADAWYSAFRAFRTIAMERGALFRPPLLVFGRPAEATGGRSAEVAADEGPDLDAWADLPVAVVTAAPDTAAVLDWLEGLVRSLPPCPGVDAPPPAERGLEPVDLGLGVPSWALPVGRLVASTTHPSAVDAPLGAFRPHVFFLDGQVVMSTSVSLSLEVVRAARGEIPRLDVAALDRSGGGRGLVALQVVDAGRVEAVARMWATFAAAGDGLDMSPPPDLTVVARCLRGLERWTSTTHQTARGRRLSGRLTLKHEPPRP